jgi:FixJ family two-component response regulator
MPVVTGPELAYRMFLHDLGLEQIPIVLLSGVLDLARVASLVGTPYYLAKPYSPRSVLTLLDRALGERAPPHPLL